VFVTPFIWFAAIFCNPVDKYIGFEIGNTKIHDDRKWDIYTEGQRIVYFDEPEDVVKPKLNHEGYIYVLKENKDYKNFGNAFEYTSNEELQPLQMIKIDNILDYLSSKVIIKYNREREKVFEGTFYEIGRQIGTYYKTIGKVIPKMKVDGNVLKKLKEIYEKYFPEKLEILKGIVSYCDYDLDDLFMYTNHNDRPLCNIFFNENDGLIGRTCDWFDRAVGRYAIYKYFPKEKNSYISVSDQGLGEDFFSKKENEIIRNCDGINEHGLYIGITASLDYGPVSNDYKSFEYGVEALDLVDILMLNCSTIEDTLKYFKTIPLKDPQNYFVADVSGNFFIVEHFSGNDFIIRNENIITNHSVARPIYNKNVENDSKKRYELIKNNIKDKDSTKKILTKLQTKENMWNLILDIKNKKYFIYDPYLKNEKELAFMTKEEAEKIITILLGELDLSRFHKRDQDPDEDIKIEKENKAKQKIADDILKLSENFKKEDFKIFLEKQLKKLSGDDYKLLDYESYIDWLLKNEVEKDINLPYEKEYTLMKLEKCYKKHRRYQNDL